MCHPKMKDFQGVDNQEEAEADKLSAFLLFA